MANSTCHRAHPGAWATVMNAVLVSLNSFATACTKIAVLVASGAAFTAVRGVAITVKIFHVLATMNTIVMRTSQSEHK